MSKRRIHAAVVIVTVAVLVIAGLAGFAGVLMQHDKRKADAKYGGCCNKEGNSQVVGEEDIEGCR